MKWQSKTSSTIIFYSLEGGGGHCGTKWPTEVVELPALNEFDYIDTFLTTSVTHIWVKLSHLFFYTIHLKKRHKEWLLGKMPYRSIKLDKMFNPCLRPKGLEQTLIALKPFNNHISEVRNYWILPSCKFLCQRWSYNKLKCLGFIFN
jgi:hypothetical protein